MRVYGLRNFAHLGEKFRAMVFLLIFLLAVILLPILLVVGWMLYMYFRLGRSFRSTFRRAQPGATDRSQSTPPQPELKSKREVVEEITYVEYEEID